MRVGYRRVITIKQNLNRQDLGTVERVIEVKASGKDIDRTELKEMMAYVRSGDEVVVHSIDRLARDLRDLQSIITRLNEKGVSISLSVIVLPLVETAMMRLQNCKYNCWKQFRETQAAFIAKMHKGNIVVVP